ncbi:MAG: hypothetical protein WAZ98_00230 [Cyclobacteriaceae bacterium]
MNFEETIREMITAELEKRDQKNQIVPVQKFCEQHDISRTTVWRAIKNGRIQASYIGKRVFIKTDSIK